MTIGSAHNAWALGSMLKHKKSVGVRQRRTVKTHKSLQKWAEDCFQFRGRKGLNLNLFISISFTKPLLNCHNGTDIKRIWAGGWTRTTANIKQALSCEERAGLQISARSRLWWTNHCSEASGYAARTASGEWERILGQNFESGLRSDSVVMLDEGWSRLSSWATAHVHAAWFPLAQCDG